MSFVVAGAALLGLVAGSYARVLAGGFGPAVGPDGDRPAVGPDGDRQAVGPDGDRLAVQVGHPAADHGGSPPPTRPDGGPSGEPSLDPSGEPEETPRDGLSREEAAEQRRAYRVEARQAFRRMVRTVPVPAWPPLVELGTAAACALVAWRLAWTPPLAAWSYAAVAGSALALIDWRTQRLPDAITLPSYPILALLLAPTGHLVPGLLGGLALAGVYAVLWFVRPGALGLGDVKLAGLAGMLTGALGLDPWIAGAVGGQFLGALYAVALLVTRRGTLRSQFPLGPFILLGALAAVLR
ncbi:A24 family peptidase [Sphaerisporangium sp. NPDC088356]|uniref:prepilin peptidase n=1 Tax=Sphaerisporangium sp. NPDC088356 TaxID=3154871 RepID=UPI0034218A4A